MKNIQDIVEIMIFDTHAHYDDEAFDEDREELLNSLASKNVEAVVNVAADLGRCHDTLELIARYSNVYGALGIHPSEVEELTEEDMLWLTEQCRLNSVRNGGRIVAVGEIGLDYHYPEPAREVQQRWFVRQLKVAREVKLPVIIHSREASRDTEDILRKCAKGLSGIIHCYSYSVETARFYEAMGFYFGIGGVVTFKNGRKLVETVDYLPLSRIVLETDCPYLSPDPYRGTRNDSSMIKYVAAKIAEIKMTTPEEVIRITTENAKRIYGLDANTR